MKKYFILPVLFIFISCKSFLLAQELKTDTAMVSKIKTEGLNHSQVMETLFNLTDVTGPRLTGSTELRRSQQWAIGRLKDWGIEKASMEAWGTFGRGWEIEKSYVAMTSPYYQVLTAVPKAWTGSTNGLVSAQVICIKADSAPDFEKYKGKLAGKIVVIRGPLEIKPALTAESKRYTDQELAEMAEDKKIAEPDVHAPADLEKFRNMRQLRQKLYAFLADEHPALLLNSRGGSMGTFYTTNGASYSTGAKPAIPELEMSPEHLNRIIRLIEAGKKVSIEAEIKTSFTQTDTLQYNVIAEIPGTDKKLKSEVVMIGAHLDSWHAATGATDNAAGCAVMMEVMRIIKMLDVHPRRTIRLALWSGEEQGILGSKGYVKNHFADPDSMITKPEYDRFSVYYNLDNGAGKIRGIYLQENDTLHDLFQSWLEPFKDMGASTVTRRSTGSTDHVPFDKVGLPGFQFIQDPMDYFNKTHHTNSDLYDRIQEDDLKQASVIIAAFVYHAAMRDEKLPRKKKPLGKS